MTRMDYRFDGSPLTETTVNSASDAAVPLAGGRHLRRAYDSSGRLWTMEAAWGEILPEAASTAGSSTLPPRVVFSYGAADRLAAIQSGGFTGAVTRTAAQESFSVTPNTGLYYPPSVYSTVYRDAQGRPSSHAAGGTTNYSGYPYPFSISTTQFGWNGDRLVSRTEAPDARWNYTYDSKGQVRDAWSRGDWREPRQTMPRHRPQGNAARRRSRCQHALPRSTRHHRDTQRHAEPLQLR